MSAPSESVVREFGAQGQPTRLTGGRGAVWRAGDVVLKPLDMSVVELECQASVLSGVGGDDIRVAAPLRSRRGALVVDGWTGWPWLVGRHAPHWPAVIDAGERLHAALRTVSRPSRVLDTRSSRWAHADRVAWGQAPSPECSTASNLAWLLQARRPVSLPAQLIHGDLTGNVLFAAGRPAAVIDFSPYWRPCEYATAIVLVDAIVSYRADARLLELLLREEEGPQLLIRAAIFRLLSDSNPAAGRYDVLLRRLRGHRCRA